MHVSIYYPMNNNDWNIVAHANVLLTPGLSGRINSTQVPGGIDYTSDYSTVDKCAVNPGLPSNCIRVSTVNL